MNIQTNSKINEVQFIDGVDVCAVVNAYLQHQYIGKIYNGKEIVSTKCVCNLNADGKYDFTFNFELDCGNTITIVEQCPIL